MRTSFRVIQRLFYGRELLFLFLFTQMNTTTATTTATAPPVKAMRMFVFADESAATSSEFYRG
ncbi:MAG: hypothetical protein II715_01385, partial [Clostridia bacterium]|nr:hypothetical protein [Clostridia bacterium]